MLAESGMPRCIVLNSKGKIIEQKSGFDKGKFLQMTNRIKSLIEL